MSRPQLIENLRDHFDKKNIFPDLEKIVAGTVTAQKPLNTRRSIAAIHKATGNAFPINPTSLKGVIKRFGPAYRVKKDSCLGQLRSMRRGPDEGTVNNPNGRTVGSKNKPKEAVVTT